MSDAETARIYLTTPPTLEPHAFADVLARVLDAVPVACVRLDIAVQDEAALAAAADALRDAAHRRDVPLVVAQHVAQVERLGLDGVHLSDGAGSVRKARRALGADRIVGCFCRASRHEGLNAGEAGADYVAFGPVRRTGLGDDRVAERDLFEWWSEMIEIPVVAEGVDAETTRLLAPVADFVVPDPSLWSEADPAAALKRLAAALG